MTETKLEIKTSGEIFEDVFMDSDLDNKNKQWISKESLIKILDKNQSGEGSKQLLIYIIKKELEKQ